MGNAITHLCPRADIRRAFSLSPSPSLSHSLSLSSLYHLSLNASTRGSHTYARAPLIIIYAGVPCVNDTLSLPFSSAPAPVPAPHNHHPCPSSAYSRQNSYEPKIHRGSSISSARKTWTFPRGKRFPFRSNTAFRSLSTLPLYLADATDAAIDAKSGAAFAWPRERANPPGH